MGVLDGQVAIVTGAGSGIGLETAKLLAAEGAQVVVTGRRRAPLDVVVAEIGTAGGRAAARPVDIENREAAIGLVQWTVDTFGRVDVLVNNAGYSSRARSIRWVPKDEWDGVINVNMEDDAIRGLTVVKDGSITWPPPPLKLPAPAAKPAVKPAVPAAKGHGHGAAEPMAPRTLAIVATVVTLVFLFIGNNAPPAFLQHFTVFVLACFVGYMVVWNVTPALHTPLMSVTNAISSIIAIGALVQVAPPLEDFGPERPEAWILGLALVGIALTTINMFGGFAVTQRMLQMFRK